MLKNSIIKGLKGSARSIITGLCIPIVVGVLCAGFRYPLGYIDCAAYGSARSIPTKYVYFECYVKDSKLGWLTQQEYRYSVLGSRVRLNQ